ncbi:MAG TPA: aldo/keto reductase, partial [Clostridiales bacterium]|nr:aldo/keto reductase [Clostridiales bacterium]
ALLDAMGSIGINAFDSAQVYGDGERVLGAWMQERGNRDQVVILTKGAHHNAWRKRVTPHDIQTDVADSLAKLMSSRIDIYILHRDDPDVPVGPIVETLSRLHDAGKIGAFGGSNWTHARIQEANDYARRFGLVPFTTSSPNYGLAEQVENPWGPGCVTLAGPEEAEARAWYQENQMAVFSYSSLGRGFFSGRVKSTEPEKAKEILDAAAFRGYSHPVNFKRLERTEILAAEKGYSVPQIALSWLLHQPLNVFPLIGANTAEEMQENIDAMQIRLTPEELRWLDLQSETR